jgi:acyl transferase domain-containing protein/NAD(P)H-dependent flavin oxidoreductase YrpB (nitropropane dioxygenase family)/NAD(P)-dependent dehydrogenase (short-subunit alcohol dehydrogenase family)
LSEIPDNLEFVVLIPGDDGECCPRLVEQLHRAGRKVWFEVTSLEEARLAEAALADGLVAKGNEAGGRIGDETAFILLQHLLAETTLPVWVQGGIGPNSAAACYVAGASGVVVDSQLLLTPESSIPMAVRAVLDRMESEETIAVGAECGRQFRILRRVGMDACDRLRDRAAELAETNPPELGRRQWRETLRSCAAWSEPPDAVWPLGQEVVFAAELAKRFYNVSGILRGIDSAIGHNVRIASVQPPLGPGSPLAEEHKLTYPIFQGPMTRVSDVAEFADAVSQNGALPFLALALLRAPQVRELLTRTKQLAGDRSWGVGILGFVSPELRAEQLEVVRELQPPCALIAGGRPDQARALEADGIPTYLHVPAPALLKVFMQDGARRFIFEGRECGGHVGPRSGFVLWELTISALLEAIREGIAASELRVIFAGGIHDSRSAAMVSALAAPLAEQGVKIGVLMGTAYLFTKEAVGAGAVVQGFQDAAAGCRETVLLESGTGHITRCARSPFVESFRALRRGMLREGRPAEEIKDELENFNLGRLRMATKGIVRASANGHAGYESISSERQWAEGMYMIGQVAGLRNSVSSMRELHESVSAGGAALLRELTEIAPFRSGKPAAAPPPCDVAIVGMSCLLPQAPSLAEFWKNLIARKDAIVEIPAARFDSGLYYDRDRKAADKIYSRWGGFLDPVPFDPARYGIPPNALPSIDPVQLFSLVAVERALADSAYDRREFDRKRASVILGLSGGLGDVGIGYAVRSNLPLYLSGVPDEVYRRLPQWTEDSFAGILLNVAAGRVANRFNLGGVNFAVDAACASSLAAVYLATRELTAGSSDMVIVGGVDTVQSPFGFLCFSKSQALSPTGRCRPFDESADGIAISEGVTMLVLKRLADAERDGDRIYAVIKGIAGSSDGRGRSMTAPGQEGQVLAISRAYEQARLKASQIGLIEAHGTGTVAGDETEIASVTEVLLAGGAAPRSCAVGSVKSVVGHTKAAAGATGLMKTALALHYRVIPPTLHMEQPNSKLREPGSPLYVNVEPRSWLAAPGELRRAGVSSFGFGGTNFHAVLEEYDTDGRAGIDAPITPDWPAELFLWEAPDAGALERALAQCSGQLQHADGIRLSQLAAAICKTSRDRRTPGVRLAIIAASVAELRERIRAARSHIDQGESRIFDARQGICLAPFQVAGPVAFLFPGQGSQYPGMLREAGLYLPEMRRHWELADHVLAGCYPRPLSRYVHPEPAFSDAERTAQMEALTRTAVAQPALGAASLSLARALERFGIRPDMTMGHSFGEYAALAAAGVFDAETLFRLAEARGRAIEDATRNSGDAGTMAAVAASAEQVLEVLERHRLNRDDVTIANLNAPRQTIISGSTAGVKEVSEILHSAGFAVRGIPVACAFHSPLMGPARDRFASELAGIRFASPRLQVYSNTLAQCYPSSPSAIAELLADHLIKPVRFVEEILAMHDAGARIFVEVGPKNVLSGLCRQILEGRDATILSTDSVEHGFASLLQSLAHLYVAGCSLKRDELFRGRTLPALDLDRLSGAEAKSDWWLNGARAYATSEEPMAMKPPVQIASPGSTQPREVLKSAPVIGITGLHPGAAGVEAVMLQYQQTMAQIAASQSAVMMSYLNGGSVADGGSGEGVAENFAAPLPVSAAEPAPVSDATPASGQPFDIQAELVRVASERTGYPADILRLDAGMEADLGIDSIKRVEILSVFQGRLPAAWRNGAQKVMEKLARARTLREIVDRIREVSFAAEPAAEPAPPAQGSGGSLPVFRLALNEIPAHLGAPRLYPRRVSVITDDETGVARRLAALLARHGEKAVLLRHASEPAPLADGCIATDVTEPESVENALRDIRSQYGPIGALLHLIPLREDLQRETGDLTGWRKSARLAVRSLYLLARAALGDLETRGRSGGATILAVTARGGEFGIGRNLLSPAALQFAVGDFVKTLATECSDVVCRVVDVDAAEPAAILNQKVFDEFTSLDTTLQAGRPGDRRLTPVVEAMPETIAPPPNGRPVTEKLGRDWVVVLTGGARGITSQVARTFAAHGQPTLILAGSTSLSAEPESGDTAGINDVMRLKMVLLGRMRETNPDVRAVDVEAASNRLLRDREIRQTIQDLKDAGCRVEYHALDVRDPAALSGFIDDVYRRHGRLDVFIHGAGVIEDRLVRDKTPDSFDRVFHTKADSAWLLTRLLRAESLRRLIFMSSISAAVGNRGQADYATANGILNGLAVCVPPHWSNKIVAMNWGPWDRGGMVTAEVRRQFLSRGVQMIPLQEGAEAVLREILREDHTEPMPILGGGPWAAGDMPLQQGIALAAGNRA